MMDRLSSMNAFVTAAELGSYARAAERLGMSPQMVAKHVAALSARFGQSKTRPNTPRHPLIYLIDIGKSVKKC